MSRLGHHSRNHSFPPALHFRQRPSKALNAPLPDINDEPWLHFLSNSEEDEYVDHLHFDAGILSTTESSKRKANKFRPAASKKWSDQPTVHHHHGEFQRSEDEHGYVRNRPDPFAGIWGDADMAASHPSDVGRQPKHHSRRTSSGHRHSWQEPSINLFTLDEENNEAIESSEDEGVPTIVISDFDERHNDVFLHKRQSLEARQPEELHFKAEAPRIDASVPVGCPDSELNQMWLGERARL